MKTVDIDYLRRRVSYNPCTGALMWMPISVDMIKQDSKRPDVAARIWNTRYAWKPAFTRTDGARLWGKLDAGNFMAHRVAWALFYGEWPQGEIDHIDGNGLNNRIDNLRVVDKSGNMRNQRRKTNNKSGATGVQVRKGKWFAYIHNGGKQVALGTFDCKRDAIAARKIAEQRYGYHENHGRSS